MWFRKGRVYLDHASAPPVLREAIRAMRETETLIGNPGAIHQEGVLAKRSLEDSRKRIAACLGCKAREVIFTSGLTEATNLAVVGYARHLKHTRRTLEGTHWIVGSIEHDSVLQAFAEVEAMGGEITHVEPDRHGIVSPKNIEAALKKETVFVSVGWANNEIGTIQPIGKISQALRAYAEKNGTSIFFHTDAGQAPLYLSTIVDSLGVDLLSLGGNKLYGPHGVGALYIKNHTEITSLSFGGHQERRLRAGTESVALAAGFATAYETIVKEREKESRRLEKLRGRLLKELMAKVPGLVVNGSLVQALPHMLNVSIPPRPELAERTSEYATLALDHEGFAVSTKSACREGEESASHVVRALGGEKWQAEHTMRISLGRGSRWRHLKRFVRTLAGLLASSNNSVR